MTIARITTKERVAKLEEEISCINRRLEELIRLFGTKDIPITSIKPNMPTVSVLNKVSPGIEPVFDLNPRTALFKKPIMYLYNMTGVTTQVTVDFGSIVIPDAIPEIRADGKISFKLDADSYIDNKYKYLYYEIEYDKPLPKPVLSIVISNDKFLSEGLANLARLCGLWSDEISDFVTYWDLELKRSDAKFWKCDIFTEKELDPILPISMSRDKTSVDL